MKYNRNELTNELLEPVLFWGDEDWGSNFHPSPIEFEGYTLTCSEQLFMLLKARHFKSPEAEAQLANLKGVHPFQYKKIGRNLPNWEKFGASWEEVKEDCMYQAIQAKFSQNESLRNELLATGNSVIVEASPYDRYWGIGLAADDIKSLTPAKWRGHNALGFLLMELRDELREKGE